MKLELPLAVHDRLLQELANSGRVEIGGVLMAEQLAPGEFRLVDLTVDSRRGSAAHFVRSVNEHRDALAAFFETTGTDYSRFNYLGEWHSHPNHAPIPSREDSASMTGLVEGDEGIPFAVLLVVRRYRGALALSATLFQRGQPPTRIDILAGHADVDRRPSGRETNVSKTSIPAKIKTALWARAAGRCEYRGCNQDLVGDLIGNKEDRLYGFVAHIVADEPGGPRGDPVRSPKLAKKLENLMLMCATHHKLIDEDWDEYPEADLIAMKEAHEARIETNGGIGEEYASYVLRFGASIGSNQALVSTQSIFAAMPPDRHPASRQTIDLEMVNQAFQDNEPAYWTLQRTNLQRLFADRIGGRIERQEIRHLSVFALAPQPLLIELGRLLYDIVPTTVHQKLREPEGWKWHRDKDPLAFITTEPSDDLDGLIALKLAVSAEVDDERIRSVLGADAAIWSVTIAQPGNDVVRRPEDLAAFRQAMREVYAAIKSRHGEGKTINLFPVLPASLAVEAGRVWMPKADLALRIYDHVRDSGFVETFTIGD